MKTFVFYSKLLGLFVLLMFVVGFNFVVWGTRRHADSPVLFVPNANAEEGRKLIREYGCGACHSIPGVDGAVGNVGPRLDHFKNQMYVAGILPNSPQNTIDWIVSPKDFNRRTAMPDLDVTKSEAAAMASYLYELP